jgi:predicted AAA+ superfamily ATPase
MAENLQSIERQAVKLALKRAKEEPVILLEGPRSSGKSTTIRALAEYYNARFLDFDDQITRNEARRNPRLYTEGESIILIDEYQRVPAILDAIKVRINKSSRPGQFILTGSTRHDAIPGSSQALTGRLHRMKLYPFAQSEIEGTFTGIISKLVKNPAYLSRSGKAILGKKETRTAYIKRIIRGGFPLAVLRKEQTRNRWFDDYIRQTVERDIPGIPGAPGIRNKRGLLQLLRQLASQTAQIFTIEKIAAAASINIATARDYVQLLEDVFMIYTLPAWGKTLGTRVASKPKIHILDSGVAGRLMGVTEEKLAAKDPSAITEFGHLLETFTVMEIVKALSWLDDTFLTGHWRTHEGKEVDFVVEQMDGSIFGFEIKSGARIPESDLSGMEALRKFAGSSFKAGFVCYLGEQAYKVSDRIYALPVNYLWA